MTTDVQSHIDTLIEDDIFRGFRDYTLPAHLAARLEAERRINPKCPHLQVIRFTQLTAKKKRLISEQVLRRYHVDLKDKTILSTAELRRINIERGEWSEDLDRRKQELQDQTNTLMRSLFGLGMKNRHEWVRAKAEALGKVQESITKGLRETGEPLNPTDQAEALHLLDRWSTWDAADQAFYDTEYAATQGRERYSVDADLNRLLDLVPTVPGLEALNDVGEYRDKISDFIKCAQLRKELSELQEKEIKMLADSIESRRDTTEEMARLYFCAERLVDGVPAGPLTPSFDDLWDLPDAVLQTLLVEIYFFLNGNPDLEASREFLEEWGFIAAPRSTSGTSESGASDASPAEPASSSASEPSAATSVGASA